MAAKDSIGKAAGTAFNSLRHPVSTTGKVVGQAKDAAVIGRSLTGQVGKAAATVATETVHAVRERAAARRSKPDSSAQPAESPASTSGHSTPLRPVVNEPAHTVAPVEPAEVPATAAGTNRASRKPAKKAPAKKASGRSTGRSTGQTAKKTAKAPAKKSTPTASTKKTPTKRTPTKRPSTKKTTATPADVAKAVESPPTSPESPAGSPPGVDVTTPAGTTGAAAGVNPDTAEGDLDQPGTEDVVESATAKQIASESDQLRKAAERDPE